MDDQRIDRDGGSMIKPLGYGAWVMAGLLMVCSVLSYTNGDLWPASIFTTLSAVAIITAWYLQRRGRRSAKEI
jgi:hypothetical protein